MRFFSLDIETTGLDFKIHQILEIAIIDSETNKIFHQYVSHNYIYIGHAIALHMNAHILKILGDRQDPKIIPNENLIDSIINWFTRELGFPQSFADPIRINIAGKNVDFDLGFISKLPRVKTEGSSLILGSCIKIRNRKIDPAILYKIDSDTELPNLKTCCQRANIEMKREHSAVDDAIAVMQLLKAKGI